MERLLSQSKDSSILSNLEGSFMGFSKKLQKTSEASWLDEIIKRLEKSKDWVSKRLKTSPPGEVFKDLLEEAKIQTKEDQSFLDKLDLVKVLVNRRSGLNDKAVSYDEFMAAVLTWALDSNPELLPENGNFINKLFEFTNSMATADNNPKRKNGLRPIFEFYAKQIQSLGRFPTFETIQRSSRVLEIGIFLRFCKDFHVIAKSKREKGVSRHTVQKVFAKHSKLQKEMEFLGFLEAIKELAGLMEYTEEQFYEFLGCYDPTVYNKKMKKGSLPFQTLSPQRIPPEDLSKRSKLNLSRQKNFKRKIRDHKKAKMEKQSTNLKMCSSGLPKIKKKNIYTNHLNLIKGPFTWKSLSRLKPEHIISKNDIKKVINGHVEDHLTSDRSKFALSVTDNFVSRD